MFVITKIEPQKKQNGFYNIYVNGEYQFSLSENDISSYQLKTNDNISPAKFNYIKQAVVLSVAYNFSLRYLSIRPRSCGEVKRYLEKKGFNEEIVNTTIKNLKIQNYLNDTEFTDLWIKNRLKLKPRSKKVLRVELLKKYIPKTIIDSALSGIDSNEEKASLQKLISKKRRQKKYQNKKALVGYLIRQGYNYSLIKEVIYD